MIEMNRSVLAALTSIREETHLGKVSTSWAMKEDLLAHLQCLDERQRDLFRRGAAMRVISELDRLFETGLSILIAPQPVSGEICFNDHLCMIFPFAASSVRECCLL